jgi:putative sigma-54 modulation protein
MKLTVTGRRLTVTDATRDQIERKLRHLERRLGDSAVSAQCVMSQERQTLVCELTVHVGGGHILHGLGREVRAAAAVASAVAKVAQQAKRVTDRWKDQRRPARRLARRPAREEPGSGTGAPRGAGPRVVRAPGYEVKPMSLDDAMLALGASDRMFLVFRHAPSERMAILFRRQDGNFGLIEPGA